MVTCYDYWTANIINETKIDCILVGDSAAMVMHGYTNTIHATIEMMVMHVRAVAKGASHKFIIADMPFLSCKKGLKHAMTCAEQLLQAGAHAIKIEGVRGSERLIQHIVESGIPVMGHLGLTPQSVHQLGGFQIQGKNKESAEALKLDALTLEKLGCFALVLECIPAELAETITRQLHIPTIGIGAGIHVDGQVLVLQDLIGSNKNFKPKFLKQYLNTHELIHASVEQFHHEVKSEQYPGLEYSYNLAGENEWAC